MEAMKRGKTRWLIELGVLLLGAAVVLLIFILRGGSNEAPGDQPTGSGNEVASATLPAFKALPPAEQLNRAFVAAFGRSGSARRSAGGQIYDYRPERLEWVGETAVLISRSDNVEGAHVSSGAMAIHYLAPTAEGFRVTGAWPTIAAGGTFGAGPQAVAIHRELSDFPVVYSEGGGTWQGYTCTWAQLVELRPDRPVASELIPISLSNEGAVMEETGRTFGGEPRRAIEGRIGNVRRNQGFDVLFTGTERFTEHYVYRDHKFVRATPESRATC